jgi:hypothetical protein
LAYQLSPADLTYLRTDGMDGRKDGQEEDSKEGRVPRKRGRMPRMDVKEGRRDGRIPRKEGCRGRKKGRKDDKEGCQEGRLLKKGRKDVKVGWTLRKEGRGGGRTRRKEGSLRRKGGRPLSTAHSSFHGGGGRFFHPAHVFLALPLWFLPFFLPSKRTCIMTLLGESRMER